MIAQGTPEQLAKDHRRTGSHTGRFLADLFDGTRRTLALPKGAGAEPVDDGATAPERELVAQP
jgi:hypothetical protein